MRGERHVGYEKYKKKRVIASVIAILIIVAMVASVVIGAFL